MMPEIEAVYDWLRSEEQKALEGDKDLILAKDAGERRAELRARSIEIRQHMGELRRADAMFSDLAAENQRLYQELEAGRKQREQIQAAKELIRDLFRG